MYTHRQKKRINSYSQYLQDIFNCKVYKITLDAGFSCPNRDGTISKNGCIFCDSGGSFSQAHSNTLAIEEQLETGILQLKNRFKAEKFISYFQAFSNTYGDIKRLKQVYDQGVSHHDVVGLSIGTRPDCVDEEKLDLIASYKEKHLVWVEYGLQSIHNKTLSFINRGHTFEDFVRAVDMTKQREINVCAHVIIGLPGETHEDIMKTARTLAELGINGVKIHLLCVLKNTELENLYNAGQIRLLGMDEYVNTVCDFLELLPPSVSIHRLAGNGLQKLLVAPQWLGEKFKVLNMIDRELEKRDSWQGKFINVL
ncbi:MAG: TIGR01212 family radical SAM protein [Candidatus Melainabacteria bacterium GWF2_37_15]|nr:MAG: TIGR01212 family radical SAM protein [Candidatus Melainabacteria bacterium GWF2_37_15]